MHNAIFSFLLVALTLVCSEAIYSQTPVSEVTKANPENSWLVNIEQSKDLLVISQSKTGPPGRKPMSCIVTKFETFKPRTFCGLLKPNEDIFVFLQTGGGSLSFREISSIKENLLVDSDPADWSIGLGMTAGINYLFNQLTFEGRLSPEITLSLSPLFLSNSDTSAKLSALAGLVYGTYYFSSAKFLTGFWAKLGMGYYSIKLEDPGSSKTSSAWSTIVTGGYRAKLGGGFTALAGAGLQYIKTYSEKDDRISFDGLHPVISVELGHRF